MITRIPAAITTVDEAKVFLTELNENNEIFHPEDNAHEVMWHAIEITHEEKDQLNKLMSEIYALDGDFDPCEFIIEINGGFAE